MDNSWVDSYLDALLSGKGLSNEHLSPNEGSLDDEDRKLYNRCVLHVN